MRLSHQAFTCSLLLALAAGSGLTGCSDPTEGKPEAVVKKAVEPGRQPRRETKPGAERYYITPATSDISFVGSKVTGSHEGGFRFFRGDVEVVDDDPTQSTIEITIDARSLWADDDRLTEHLQSPDFFDVETYPRAFFTSTGIERQGDGYVISGDLELHGVKKNISFPAEIAVGDGTMEANAEFSIKRFDFGIEYPGKPDDLIRDDVLIKLDIAANRGRGRGNMSR